jgi:hypothetical protein
VAGTPGGDFSTIELEDGLGWVVTCQHPDILTYVAPEAPDDDTPGGDDLMIGLTGRAMRDADAHELIVVHIEDRRTAR